MVYFLYQTKALAKQDMSLQEKIREDMVQAMKAKEEVRLRVLRGLISLFTQELTATKRTPRDILSDSEVLALIKRSVKQRQDASEQFTAGKRDDLAQIEIEEAKILNEYLPEMMSKEAVERVVKEKMKALSITDKSDTGKLIGAVMAQLQGKADGKVVKEIIDEMFAS